AREVVEQPSKPGPKQVNFGSAPPPLRAPKLPVKELLLSLMLFFVGLFFLLAGANVFFKTNLSEATPYNVLGSLCFIPGAYHTFIFVMVWNKARPRPKEIVTMESLATANVDPRITHPLEAAQLRSGGARARSVAVRARKLCTLVVVSQGTHLRQQPQARSTFTLEPDEALAYLSEPESFTLDASASEDEDDENAVLALKLAVRRYALKGAQHCPPGKLSRPVAALTPLKCLQQKLEELEAENLDSASESEDEEALDRLKLSVRRWALRGAGPTLPQQ
ncbi:unnamed protein product, partial [Polarella glacialis]